MLHTHARGLPQLLRTPPSRSALAGAKAPSPSCKDERSPGCPGRLPRLAECLGTSGRGQVQGIELTNGRAVCPGRRGIQAPTRRPLILAIGGPTERCPPGSRAGTWHNGHKRVDSPRFPAQRERMGGPSPTPGQAVLLHPPAALVGTQLPCNCPSRSPPKQGQDQAVPTLCNAFHPGLAGFVAEQTDKPTNTA